VEDDAFFWNNSPSPDTSTDPNDAQSPHNSAGNTNTGTQIGTHNGIMVIGYDTGVPPPTGQGNMAEIVDLSEDEVVDMSEMVESDEMSDTDDEYYQQLTTQIQMASASDGTSFDTPVLLPGHNGPNAALADLAIWTQTSNFSYIGGNDVISSGENQQAPLGGMSHAGINPIAVYSAMRRDQKKPFFESNRTNTLAQRASAPGAPIMIVSKQDVFLLQPLSPENNFEGNPIIAMNDPLLSSNGNISPVHDRLCFTTEIPELGIVLVGSPVGRVSILTLTHTRIRQSKHGKTIYGFRYSPSSDILPFAAQKEAYPQLGNPQNRLVGMAASPMQGMQGTSEGDTFPSRVQGSRRWRLILLYKDNTMLSYELSWRREAAEATLSTIVV
jgi:hypothetical protein